MPILKRVSTVAVAATLLAAGLAGCGGGDDPKPAPAAAPPAEPAAITKAELISRGDGLCAEVNAAVGSILDSTTVSDSDKAGQVSGLYGGLADRIEKLGTPDDGPAPTDVIAAIRRLADPEAGDQGTTELLDAADAYGFTECGKAPSAPAATVPDTGSAGTAGPDTGTASEAPSNVTTPPPAPAPAPSTGGVTPGTPSTGGAAPPSGGSTGGTSGGSTGGIGPG